MRVTSVLGNLNDPSYEILLRRELGGFFETDELALEWDEARGAGLSRATARGRVIELARADGEEPLQDGDVLACDRSGAVPVAVVVRLRTAEALLVEVDRAKPLALAQACWEIGNMHAPLFEGDSDERTVRVLTPAMPVVERMLAGIPGLALSKRTVSLDPSRRFTSSATEVVVGFSADFNIVKKARA